MAPPSIASLLQPYTPPPLRDGHPSSNSLSSFNRLSDMHSPDHSQTQQPDSSTRSTVYLDATSECGEPHEASSPSYAWNSATEQSHCSAAAAAERQPSFTLEWQRGVDEEEDNSQHSRSFSGGSGSASTETSIDPHQLSPTTSMAKQDEFGDNSQAGQSTGYMTSGQFISDAMDDALVAAANAAATASASASPDLPAPTPARFTTSVSVQQQQQYDYHSDNDKQQQQQLANTPRSLPTLELYAALNPQRSNDATPSTYMRPYEPRQPYYSHSHLHSQAAYMQQQQQQASSSSSTLREQQQAFGVQPSLALSSHSTSHLNGNAAAAVAASFYAPPTLNAWSTSPSRQLPPLIFGTSNTNSPPALVEPSSNGGNATPSLFYPPAPAPTAAATAAGVGMKQPLARVPANLAILQDAALYDGASTSSHASTSSTSKNAHDEAQKQKQKREEAAKAKEQERMASLYRPTKRRRKYDEVQRTYFCDFQGCKKSYGTLGHLNHHRDMSKHGARIRQIDLDRKAKDAEVAAAAAAAAAAEAEAEAEAAQATLTSAQLDSLNSPSPDLTPAPEPEAEAGPSEQQQHELAYEYEEVKTPSPPPLLPLPLQMSQHIMAPGSWIASSAALAQYSK